MYQPLMYHFNTYIKYLPMSVLLHSTIGLYISVHPKINITINNDPKWLVMTKVTLCSALWGTTYPITWPISVFVTFSIIASDCV